MINQPTNPCLHSLNLFFMPLLATRQCRRMLDSFILSGRAYVIPPFVTDLLMLLPKRFLRKFLKIASPYVRLCTKRFFDFNEIWHVGGRGQWAMHDGMQYDPIQGQCQGHDSWALESWNSSHFQKLYAPPFTMGAGSRPRILNLGHNI